MNFQDVSRADDSRSFLEKQIQNAERARARKGQVPQDYPPARLLVARFMMKLYQDAMVAGSGEPQFHTSQTPPPYLPSVCSVRDLRPMMISQMVLEEHHRGKKALLRVMTPPDRMTAVMAIVEDEEGTAVLLQLYNQPEAPEVDAIHILHPGMVCIVKEPFFKASISDGSYNVRVDHVSDIVWLHGTDERIPLKWRRPTSSLGDSNEIRMRGNSAVKDKDWGRAERLYTYAIRASQNPEQEQKACLNRSLANLRLGRPKEALADASKNKSPSEKELFRQAKALYGLEDFGASLKKFQTLVNTYPTNEDAALEIRRVEERLHEQETGVYRFATMHKQAKVTPPIIDCATYVGPVAVRASPGRGKGLFTTKPVKAGDLLLCEKAFAYSYAGDDDPVGSRNTRLLMNLATKRASMGGQAHLISQIVQKLYHDHPGADLFRDLYHGDYVPVTASEVDGQPIVDTFLVDSIIALNGFGAPRTSHKMFTNVEDGVEKAATYSTCGIWLLASRINHSCLSNCRRSFVGDMQIVRACKDLEADAELRFCYQALSPNASYEETQDDLRNWGFTCECALCLDRKATPKKKVQKRKDLLADLRAAMMRSPRTTAQIAKARRLLGQLEKTYPARGEGAVRMELWEYYFALGRDMVQRDKPVDAIELTAKGFEALGYRMACPSRGDAPALEIKQWGQVNEYTVAAFIQMSQAYEKMAPGLAEVAKRYARIVYGICVGETDTIETVYPMLA